MRRALVVALSLACATPALAWEPIYPTRPVWRPPAPYSLNRNGSADLGGFAATEPEVRRAMDDWTRVACTSLRTNYNGMTASVPGSYEGVSVIGWIESGWRHGSSAIGVTGPRWGSHIVEADMELNGVNFTWTTGSGSFSNVNTYSIVLHEGGHYYGLGHTNVRGSAMWPSYSGGIVGLGPDDEAGICALYPGSGTDCTTTGCPTGQECVDRACRPVMGDGTVCSPCTTSSQCGGPSDLCLGYPDGGGFCGRACSSDADCAGDRCVSTSGGPQCVRFSGSMPTCRGTTPPPGCTRDTDCRADQLCSGGACVARPPTGAELGAPCGADADCRSTLCIAGVCTQTCDWLNTTSCPSGFYCDADVLPSCNNGYCMRGATGIGALGDPCGADTECSSLFCDGGMCSQPCIPGGAVGCPEGYTCQVGALPCQGSCRRARALGDGCDTNEQCASGACATRGEETFCTQMCGDASPCPARFACIAAGDQSVCVPEAGGLDADCRSDAECLESTCTTEHGASYCTRGCGPAMPCPDGFFCGDSETDTAVCIRTERDLGQSCDGPGACESRMCAAVGEETFCTRPCSGELPCPEGFACVPAGENELCRPTAPVRMGGCGCATAGGARVALVPALVALMLFLRRRR